MVPCPGWVLTLIAALQRIEHGLLDHVHAHAAPGQVGDDAAGGKAGHKNQVDDLLVAECSSFFGAEQAFFHRLVAHGLQGDAGAIVLNVDGHPAAILAGAE